MRSNVEEPDMAFRRLSCSAVLSPFCPRILFCMTALIVGLGTTSFSNTEKIRKEERFRKHGALAVGSRVTLGPVNEENWSPEQNRYVGEKTQVVELVPGPDRQGCYGVRVAIDGGVYFWRVRDLEGQGLQTGKFLACERMGETEIPLCVIALRNDVSLFDAPSPTAAERGRIALLTVTEGERSWAVPRHVYVHEKKGGWLQVMESDYGSREALGWLREQDVVVWPTRQGYVINRARSGRAPLLGFADPSDIMHPEKAVFQENLDSSITFDPNLTGMCEGLLLQRRTVRGIEAVQCAITPAWGDERRVVWVPMPRGGDSLLPYVLMTEYDLLQLSAEFAFLYAACAKGYVDEIRQALEEEWDQEAKAMTGTKEKAQKYARFYREVQAIYPALTRRLDLPPGETTEHEFQAIGERAIASQAYVQRVIDAMVRDGRKWAWVKISDL